MCCVLARKWWQNQEKPGTTRLPLQKQIGAQVARPSPSSDAPLPLPQVMRDYQSPATIKMYMLIALPLMICFLAPYFALLLTDNSARRPLVFILSNILVFVTILLISVQVCPHSAVTPCSPPPWDLLGGGGRHHSRQATQRSGRPVKAVGGGYRRLEMRLGLGLGLGECPWGRVRA